VLRCVDLVASSLFGTEHKCKNFNGDTVWKKVDAPLQVGSSGEGRVCELLTETGRQPSDLALARTSLKPQSFQNLLVVDGSRLTLSVAKPISSSKIAMVAAIS
jgi:hypothetical protein